MLRQSQGPAVAVHDLGMCFRAEAASIDSALKRTALGAKRWAAELRRGRIAPSALAATQPTRGKWVFRHISFDVAQGEVFGIIGANGSGKTTLLKILSGVLFPTEGRARIRGQVAAMLAVGTGFNTAYTGRENVFLNGLILGMSQKEIERNFDAIADFAEIGDAIEMPVRTYSSGMRARLAFAVAAQLRSHIVLLDEILAVGDAGFRDRCLNVVRQMKRDGRTVLLVSHNMSSIESFCDRAMLIKEGRIACMGDPHDVTEAYLGQFRHKNLEGLPLSERADRFGSGVLLVTDMYFETGGVRVAIPRNADDVVITIEYEIKSQELPRTLEVGVGVKEEDGRKLVRLSTDVSGEAFMNPPRFGRLSVAVPRFPLVKGTYMLGFRILCDGELADHIPDALKFQCEEGDFFGTGVSDLHSPIYLPHEWRMLSRETAASAEKRDVSTA
jgi:lipopolysaccharide transport system ATP-binding protein